MSKLKLTWIKFKWFLIIWFIINILQAIYTNLHYDEAYYWLYSTKLDWGYFDHPPMISLLAKLGDIIHHSQLGIRIFPIIMGAFTLFGIFYLIDDAENYKKVIIYTISFPLITSHIAGIFIIPDAPLVLFFILYLLSYRKYLEDDNLKNTIIFSLIIAAMFYSKYHAGLVIILTIISNFNLLKKKSFWLAGIFSLILLSPHIFWLYNNDFPSILYHINDRATGFNQANFFRYISTQIIAAGPFSGLIIIWLAIKFKSKNQFDKTLKYIALGFYVFFLFYCFKGHVETHWTAISTIALIIISYKELQYHSKLNKKIYYLLIPSVVLLIFGRIILSTNYLDDKLPFKSYFINMNEFSNELDSIAENHPVLFTSKYHYLSIYSFAKNKLIPGSPNYSKRFSQVDLNKIDSIYNGKRIFALNYGNEKIWTSNTHLKLRGSFINNYYSYTGLKLDNIELVSLNESTYLIFNLTNETNKSFLLKKDDTQQLILKVSFNNNSYNYSLHKLNDEQIIHPNSKIKYKINIKNLEDQENVLLDIGLASNGLRVFRERKKKYNITY